MDDGFKWCFKNNTVYTDTAELAVRFGRKVRNLIDSDDFKTIFPNLFSTSRQQKCW